jgi:ABC-type uncharacterized transport system auxiliary subunit
VTRAVVIALLVGCGGSPPPATHYYQLAPPSDTGGRSGGDATLVVEPLTTDSGYDDERIVYRPSPYRLEYYDYHRWSAPPGEMVASYLERALERSGKFRAVVRSSTPDATAVLSGRVAAIEEVDVSRQRWVGRIVVELTLADATNGEALWTAQFEETEPLRAQSPDGLARALSVALGRIVRRATPALDEATQRARVRQTAR